MSSTYWGEMRIEMVVVENMLWLHPLVIVVVGKGFYTFGFVSSLAVFGFIFYCACKAAQYCDGSNCRAISKSQSMSAIYSALNAQYTITKKLCGSYQPWANGNTTFSVYVYYTVKTDVIMIFANRTVIALVFLYWFWLKTKMCWWSRQRFDASLRPEI